MMCLENPKQFIEIFNFTPETNYYDPIILSDEDIGFSVKRKYSKNIRFKPPVKQNGEPDEVIIIWLVYALPRTKGAIDFKKVPICIKIRKYSLYKTKHFDYNFDDPECPTKESIDLSEKSSQPLEIDYKSDFFYSHKKECFFDRKGKEYSGIEMLDTVVAQHLKTVHIIKGLKIRFKLFVKSLLVKFFEKLILILIYTLKYIFGRSLGTGDSQIWIWDEFKKEDVKKSQTIGINMFGYKASIHVIVLFCIIIVSIGLFIYFSKSKIEYFNYLSENYLLMSAHTIVLLVLLDFLIPNIIFFLINLLIKFRNKIYFHRFRV